MNSLIYVIKISKALKAKTLTVFLHQFSRLFCLLSSKILQNNLLDLHLVEICRYKLSFYAKTAQMLLPTHRHFFLHFWKIVVWSSKLAGGWSYAHNWLKLLTSSGPNLEAIRSNAIFFLGAGDNDRVKAKDSIFIPTDSNQVLSLFKKTE